MPDESPPLPELPSDDETSDDLVAYLDGELDESTSRIIESQIASDSQTRQKSDLLKKTYDLLDYLPKTEPSPTFASRTLTQLSLSAPAQPTAGAATLPATATSGYVIPPPPPTHRGRMLAIWCVILSIATALGYFGHLLARPHLEATDPSKRTSEQVRLLERLPLYLGVDDLDFARQLESAEFFGEVEFEGSRSNGLIDTLTSTELVRLENLFKSYPLSRQQQLRKLDEEISNESADRQVALLETLERYAIWLDRLPDSYRKEVLMAPAAFERLEAIRIIRSRLWREGLPASIRNRIQQAEISQRDTMINEIKQQDTRRRTTWELARREWANIRTDRRPWPFDDEGLTEQVNRFVDEKLRTRLSNAERIDLESMRKDLTMNADWFKWYLYGNTVFRLSELHPTLPEPISGKLIKSHMDLPAEFLQQLRRKSGPGRRQLVQHPSSGKWPDFAETVVKEASELKVPFPKDLVFGPSRLTEYTPPVRTFVETQLLSELTPKEKGELSKAESIWPDHSQKIMELARKHDLSVPGVTLPGAPSNWEKTYRTRPAKR